MTPGGRAVVAALLLLAASASAEPKKDTLLRLKSPHHGVPPLPGTKPAALINLYNEHTREWLAIDPTRRLAVEVNPSSIESGQRETE